MDEQERKILDEVLRLSRDNNVMVRKLVSAHRRVVIWRFIYWTVIIGSAIAAYYSIQPYFTSLVKLYAGQNVDKVFEGLKTIVK